MAKLVLGPAVLDISGIRAGDLNEFQVTMNAGGKPMDLTGQNIIASAKTSKTATESLVATITVVDAVKGIVTVRWPGDDVRTWLETNESGSGVWDLQMSSGTADPITVLAGSFQAELDVTVSVLS